MITDYIGGLLRTCYGIGLRNGLQGKRYLSPLTDPTFSNSGLMITDKSTFVTQLSKENLLD